MIQVVCFQSMYKHEFSEGFQNPYLSDLECFEYWSWCPYDDWRERCSGRWCSDRRLHSSDKQSNVKVDGYTDGCPVTLSPASHWSLSPQLGLWLAGNICTPICQYGQRLQHWRRDASEKLHVMAENSCLKSEIQVKLDSTIDQSNFSRWNLLNQKPNSQKPFWQNKLKFHHILFPPVKWSNEY